MPGLLDGQLAKTIYAGFRNKLQKGTLWRATPAPSGGLDAFGDPLVTDPQTWPCQGFTDAYDAAYKARAGIPETDVSVNIFAMSLANGAVTPGKDDKVLLAGQWWQARRVQTDPAKALWTIQSFACLPPPGFL